MKIIFHFLYIFLFDIIFNYIKSLFLVNYNFSEFFLVAFFRVLLYLLFVFILLLLLLSQFFLMIYKADKFFNVFLHFFVITRINFFKSLVLTCCFWHQIKCISPLPQIIRLTYSDKMERQINLMDNSRDYQDNVKIEQQSLFKIR